VGKRNEDEAIETTGGGEKVLEENNCRRLHSHKERSTSGEPNQEQRTSLLQQSKSMREKYPERKSQRLHSRADESTDPRKIELVAAVEKSKYAWKESQPAPVAPGRYELRPKATASLGERTETESSPVVRTGGAHSSLTLTRDTNCTRGARRHGGGKSQAESGNRTAGGSRKAKTHSGLTLQVKKPNTNSRSDARTRST
jgi:hypothetical protein